MPLQQMGQRWRRYQAVVPFIPSPEGESCKPGAVGTSRQEAQTHDRLWRSLKTSQASWTSNQANLGTGGRPGSHGLPTHRAHHPLPVPPHSKARVKLVPLRVHPCVCVCVGGQRARTEPRRSQHFTPGPGLEVDASGPPAPPALLPVPTVVFHLQQGLFSKSGLKWLGLSSLLLYELKTKPKKKEKIKQKKNPNNYKYKDSHSPDACSLCES